MLAFQKELESGSPRLELDPDDLEQSLLKQHLSKKLKPGEVPDLVGITRLAQTSILGELERMIGLTVAPGRNHYAVLSGIQIHGPDRRDFVCPGPMYAMVDGKRSDLSVA